MLLLIGIYFVLQSISMLGMASFAVGLSCMFTCNEVTPVAKIGIVIQLVMVILTIIEAVGLKQRQYWARPFGIVLGILFLLPQFVMATFMKAPVPSVFSFALIPDLLTVLGIIYLIRSPQNVVWKQKNKSSDIWMYTFCITAISLAVFNSVNVVTVEQPIMRKQEVDENRNFKFVLKAGTPYNNGNYGFELTFPVDKKVYEEVVELATKNGPDSYATLSFTNDSPFNGNEMISVTISDNDTIDDYVAGMKRGADPRTKFTNVVINGIPFTKIDSEPNSEIYLTAYNKKIYRFDNENRLTPDQFYQIMQTLKFTNVSGQ